MVSWDRRIFYAIRPIRRRSDVTWVTSSCLCKNPEGAVFPLQVKALEDGINNAISALDIQKAHRGPGAPPYLHETTLDDVGGGQLSPQMPGKAAEGPQR